MELLNKKEREAASGINGILSSIGVKAAEPDQSLKDVAASEVEEVSVVTGKDRNRTVPSSVPKPSPRKRAAAKTVLSEDRSAGPADKEQFRVVISKSANAVLKEVVDNINAGYEGGLVERTDVANYVFLNLARLLTDSDFKTLRANHFDAKKALSAYLKNPEDIPEELQKALRIVYGISEPKKRST